MAIHNFFLNSEFTSYGLKYIAFTPNINIPNIAKMIQSYLKYKITKTAGVY